MTQTTPHSRLTNPSATNEPRQVSQAISAAINGGVMALPSRAKAWVRPCAKPRLLAGVQYCIARVAVGKVAPSPKPRATRAMNSVTKPGDKAGHDGRGRPDQAAPEQRPARTEMVSDPAADHLEQQIGIGKGREHQAKLGVAEMEFLLDFAGRRADVHPVDIGDEIHDAEHRQHDVGGLEPKPHLLLPPGNSYLDY